MAQPGTLTIGTLATATATKVETIRYYERIGLMPEPARSAGNYRTYDGAHVARLRFVRRARDLGFTIEQIRVLLDLADQRDRDCAVVDAIAREHLLAIERKIADLNALRGELHALIDRCAGGTIADCRIIEALSP
jgi:Cu(I)-responsive transcriptional regulator